MIGFNFSLAFHAIWGFEVLSNFYISQECSGNCEIGNCEQDSKVPLKEAHQHDPSSYRIKQTNDNSNYQADDKVFFFFQNCKRLLG